MESIAFDELLVELNKNKRPPFCGVGFDDDQLLKIYHVLNNKKKEIDDYFDHVVSTRRNKGNLYAS